MNVNHPSYPEYCPHCSEAAGWPYAAGTCEKPDVIVVRLRCSKCNYEWRAEAQKAPLSTVTL